MLGKGQRKKGWNMIRRIGNKRKSREKKDLRRGREGDVENKIKQLKEYENKRRKYMKLREQK